MRRLLLPPSSTRELEQSLQKLGATKTQIESWNKTLNPTQDKNPMPIAKQNWHALNLFLLLATQWRIDGGNPTGIDYSAIAPAAKLADVTLSPVLFEQLRRMEQAALDIFADHKATQHKLAPSPQR